MKMKTLDAINEEIYRLEQKRQDLLNKDKLKEQESIQDLKWTQDYEARLEVSTLCSAGIPRYSIIVYGNPPGTISPICIMGEHTCYEYNIMYGRTWNFYHFYTSSCEMLIEFLEHVKFKELLYDKEHLKVLEAVRKYNETI